MEDVFNTLKVNLKNQGMKNLDHYDSILKNAIMEVLVDEEVELCFQEDDMTYNVILVMSHKPDIIEEISSLFYYRQIASIGKGILLFVRKQEKNKKWYDSFIFWR